MFKIYLQRLIYLMLTISSFAHADILPSVPEMKSPETNSTNSIPIVIDSVDHIRYSSPISAFIERIEFKEGAVFKKGDILIQYNCTALRSEQAKAQSSVNFLKEKSSNVVQLHSLGGASNNEQAEAQSQFKSAQEELNIKSYLVSQCEIEAPFDGQVIKVIASPFEYIEQGKPLIEIVNLKNLEIKLILPSQWLGAIKAGTHFDVDLNETHAQYPAVITRVVYAIDPVSNTFIAYARFVKDDVNVQPGMSGNATFGLTL